MMPVGRKWPEKPWSEKSNIHKNSSSPTGPKQTEQICSHFLVELEAELEDGNKGQISHG